MKYKDNNKIEVNVENEIAFLTINRAKKLNALNGDLVAVFIKKLKELESDEQVKGIVLTGVDKSFIVGADINEMKKLDTETSINFISNLHILLNTIRTLDKPIIAAINGYCFGAGLELAISCDLLVSSNKATFGMQEVQIGIPSVIEAALLPFIIGINKTRELLLTGEVINANSALDMGLVNYVVEDSELFKKTMEYTENITKNPSNSVKLQKQLINRWLENAGLDQSIKNGIDYFGIAFANSETNTILNNTLK